MKGTITMSRNQYGTHGTFIPDTDAVDISDEELKEMARKATEIVTKIAVGTDGMNPMVMVHYRDLAEDPSQLTDMKQVLVVIASDFNEDEEKREAMREIGIQCKDKKMIPCAVFMASEAWMSMQDKKDVDANGFTRPRDDPNRKEVLIISGMTIKKEVIAGMIPIKRDENNLIVKDGEPDFSMQCEAFLLSEFFNGYFESTKKKYGL